MLDPRHLEETTGNWQADEYGDYLLVTNETQLDECLRELRSAPRIGLDFEATDLSPFTAIPLLLSLSVERDSGRPAAYVIVLPNLTDAQVNSLRDVLQNQSHLVIGHNLSYDYKLGKQQLGIEVTRLYDTMLVEQVLTSGDFDEKTEWLRHLGLGHLVNKYLGITLDKEERKTFLSVVPSPSWRPSWQQTLYAARDVFFLHQLAKKQSVMLRQEKLTNSVQLRFQALPPICDMELHGMLVDQEAWRGFLKQQETLRREAEIKLIELLTPYELAYQKQEYAQKQHDYEVWVQAREAELTLLRDWHESLVAQGKETMGWGDFKNAMFGEWRSKYPNPGKPKPIAMDFVINLSSPLQVKRALNALGLSMDSTDRMSRERALKRKLNDEQREVLEVYGDYTKYNKILTGFGEKLLDRIRDTGRLHASYNIHLTETGRMSSYNPNMQNIPRESVLRHAFIADPGCMVITADFKSQELVVSAALSGDMNMRADLMAGKDLYKELASQVFNVPVWDVTKDQRQMCKNAMLGITYGLSAVGMEKRYFVEKQLAQRLLDGVKTKYSNFVRWSDQQVANAEAQGYVETAAGTRRYFRDLGSLGWKIRTEPRNAPVQGTAADIVYRMAYRLKKALPEGAYVANIVHDEAVVVCPEGLVESTAKLVEREMQAAFNDILPYEKYGLRVGVDVHVASCWAKE